MIILNTVVLWTVGDDNNITCGLVSLCQGLLLKQGTLQTLTKVLDRCFVIVDIDADGKQTPDGRSSAKGGFSFFSWCLPIFKFIMLLFHSETSRYYSQRHDL